MYINKTEDYNPFESIGIYLYSLTDKDIHTYFLLKKAN